MVSPFRIVCLPTDAFAQLGRAKAKESPRIRILIQAAPTERQEAQARVPWLFAEADGHASRLFQPDPALSTLMKAHTATEVAIAATRARGRTSHVSHTEFMRMLECSWYSKEASQANIMAVLKRTHILFVNTATRLYVRPASETETPVLRFPLGGKTDFLHADSRNIYDYQRKGGTDLPADYGMKVGG